MKHMKLKIIIKIAISPSFQLKFINLRICCGHVMQHMKLKCNNKNCNLASFSIKIFESRNLLWAGKGGSLPLRSVFDANGETCPGAPPQGFKVQSPKALRGVPDAPALRATMSPFSQGLGLGPTPGMSVGPSIGSR